MKFYQFLLLAFFLSAATLNAQSTDSKKYKTLPDVSIKNLDGKSVNIQDFAKNGKITVMSFWATWCHPCKRELDAIADLYPDWQEDYDMELVAVTIDDTRSMRKVKPMVETKGWEYIVLSDANEDLKRALNFQTVPMTLLLDQNGNIVYEHNSYSPGDEDELEDKIKALAMAAKK